MMMVMTQRRKLIKRILASYGLGAQLTCLPSKPPFPFYVGKLLTVSMVSKRVLIRPVPQLAQADAVLGIMLVVFSLASFVLVEAVHCVLAGMLVGMQISH